MLVKIHPSVNFYILNAQELRDGSESEEKIEKEKNVAFKGMNKSRRSRRLSVFSSRQNHSHPILPSYSEKSGKVCKFLE